MSEVIGLIRSLTILDFDMRRQPGPGGALPLYKIVTIPEKRDGVRAFIDASMAGLD